jgi:hypothetical protein
MAKTRKVSPWQNFIKDFSAKNGQKFKTGELFVAAGKKEHFNRIKDTGTNFDYSRT